MGNSVTVSGVISGSRGFIKYNPGNLTLAGVNTFTGTNLFEAGVVSISADNNLGAVPGSTVANSLALSNVTLNVSSSFAMSAKRGITLKGTNVDIDVNSGQTLSYGGIITGAFQVIKSSAGTLALSGVNTYTGTNIISAGSLALTGTGSLAAGSSVAILPGATFDVSGLTSGAYTIGSSATLYAIGFSAAPAMIVGPSAGTVSLGTRPLVISFVPTSFSGDITHPGLLVTQGALTLNNNIITVTNNGGTALGAGTYLLAQVGDGTTGVINGTPNSAPVTVSGAGVAAGLGAGVMVSNGNIYLLVNTAPAFSNLSSSQTSAYATSPIMLTGTISAPGPVYPAEGDTITVTIDGNAQTTTINDSTGDFSIIYDSSTIPARATAWPITYSFAGDSMFSPATDASTTLLVTPVPLTITANNESKQYGQVAPLPGTAFSSSILYNSDSITSVTLASPGAVASASVSGSPYVIVPSAAVGTGLTNYTITYVDANLHVVSATLSVNADNLSRPYGATNQPLTYTFTNFVNGETLGTSDVTGAPDLEVTADTNSPVGEYDIANNIGTLSSMNYNFGLADGTLTITNAVSTNVITASANPALPGTNVVFTNTLGTLAPSMAVPSGTIQFVVDGTPFGDPITLTNGVAITNISTLSHGNHTIESDYTGSTNSDGTTNILGSTNILTELINTPPIASPVVYSRPRDVALNLAISDLLTNASDPDGDAVSFVSVSPVSEDGATVLATNGFVSYTPLATNGNVTDTFAYTVSDIYGATGSGTVTITIAPDNNSPSVNITGLMTLPDGTAQISFAGIPGRDYLIQAATNMTPPISWTTIATNMAGTNGLFQFDDLDSTNYPTRFYRTTTP